MRVGGQGDQPSLRAGVARVGTVGERDEDVNVQQVLHSAAESAALSFSRESGFWPGASGLKGKPVTALMAKPWGADRSFFLTTRTVLGARVLALVSVRMPRTLAR